MNIFQQARLLMKLQPCEKQFETEIKMKFSLNMILQLVATAIQAANIISGYLSPHGQAITAAAVGIVQTVVSAIAHFSVPPNSTTDIPTH